MISITPSQPGRGKGGEYLEYLKSLERYHTARDDEIQKGIEGMRAYRGLLMDCVRR
jgi:hypothetical protein